MNNLKENIKIELKNAENIAQKLGTLFMSMDAMKARYNLTSEQAVKKKEIADTYLKKYGAKTLNEMITEIHRILENIPCTI
jgi:actin-like ATPase involved in cell morphogenesis